MNRPLSPFSPFVFCFHEKETRAEFIKCDEADRSRSGKKKEEENFVVVSGMKYYLLVAAGEEEEKESDVGHDSHDRCWLPLRKRRVPFHSARQMALFSFRNITLLLRRPTIPSLLALLHYEILIRSRCVSRPPAKL